MSEKNKKAEIILLISGIAMSVFFIALGYWMAAILGFVIEGTSDFGTALCIVLGTPFARYFNNLTPVGMILGFIIAEGVFFFLIVRNRKNDDTLNEEDYAPDIIDVADKIGKANVKNQDVNLSDKKLFEKNNYEIETVSENKEDSYIRPQDTDVSDSEEDTKEIPSKEEQELSFCDETVTNLLNDYDLSQIAAMLQIKKYMEVDDAILLKKMFKPSMSAEDITAYIEMFYE